MTDVDPWHDVCSLDDNNSVVDARRYDSPFGVTFLEEQDDPDEIISSVNIFGFSPNSYLVKILDCNRVSIGKELDGILEQGDSKGSAVERRLVGIRLCMCPVEEAHGAFIPVVLSEGAFDIDGSYGDLKDGDTKGSAVE